MPIDKKEVFGAAGACLAVVALMVVLGSGFGNLADTSFNNLMNNQTVVYNSTSGLWVNVDQTSFLIGPITLDAANITSGVLNISRIPTLSLTHSNISDWASTMDWSYIQNKPSTFTPSSHIHAASDITSGTFGTSYLDLSALAQNIAFTSTQTVDGVDISALLLKTTKATDLGSIWDKTTKIIYTDTDFANQSLLKSSSPLFSGLTIYGANRSISMTGFVDGQTHQIMLRPNGDYGAGMTVGSGYSIKFTTFNQYDPFIWSSWDGAALTNVMQLNNAGQLSLPTDGSSGGIVIDDVMAYRGGTLAGKQTLIVQPSSGNNWGILAVEASGIETSSYLALIPKSSYSNTNFLKISADADNSYIDSTSTGSGTPKPILFQFDDSTKAYFTVNGQLNVPTAGSTGGLVIGGDVFLYRSAAGALVLNAYDANLWLQTTDNSRDIIFGTKDASGGELFEIRSNAAYTRIWEVVNLPLKFGVNNNEVARFDATTGLFVVAGNSVISGGTLTVASGSTGTLSLGDGSLYKTSGDGFVISSGLYPSSDNQRELGDGGRRWLSIRVGTGTSQFDGGVATKYITGDYGAAWASISLPTGVNGLLVVAYNSNAGVLASRLYVYTNSAWHYTALI